MLWKLGHGFLGPSFPVCLGDFTPKGAHWLPLPSGEGKPSGEESLKGLPLQSALSLGVLHAQLMLKHTSNFRR